MLQFTLKVVEIRQETSDTLTICFKQPGIKKIKYFAGQYLTLVLRINNRRYFRPYSFSSAPGIDSTLNITVKKVPGGVVSNYIANHIKTGDTVEVLEPMGNFTLENKNISNNNQLVFWGAGSGITPLYSIIKHALNNNLAKHVTLIYGNRNCDNTIFNQEIIDLQKKYSTSFSVWYFHTDFKTDRINSAIIKGRIDVQRIVEILKTGDELNNTFHFLCGPDGLTKSVEVALKNEGVSQQCIYTESFELVINPEYFEEIITQHVLFKKAGEEYNVEVTKGKTLLEAGLDAMIDLSYSCQTGSCLLCKAKLVSGKLKVIKSSENTKMLETDEHLLCCSLPATNDVELLVS